MTALPPSDEAVAADPPPSETGQGEPANDNRPVHRLTLSALALGVAGVLFIIYPVLHPYAGDVTAASASAFASPAWLIAHLCAIVGFVGVGFGVLGLRDALAGYRGGGTAAFGLIAWWVGAGLCLTYFGAEAYGLNALGHWVERTRQFGLLGLADQIRNEPVALVVLAVGLGLLAIAGILTAIAVARSGALPAGSGLLFALGFCALLTQFFAPSWVRILHGLVVGIGCIVLALQLRRLDRTG